MTQFRVQTFFGFPQKISALIWDAMTIHMRSRRTSINSRPKVSGTHMRSRLPEFVRLVEAELSPGCTRPRSARSTCVGRRNCRSKFVHFRSTSNRQATTAPIIQRLIISSKLQKKPGMPPMEKHTGEIEQTKTNHSLPFLISLVATKAGLHPKANTKR